MTLTISTAAMASAVSELDTVSMVNSKNPDVYQVAGKSRKLKASKNDKEEAYGATYSTGGAGKKRVKDKEEAYSTGRAGKRKNKDKEEAYSSND